MNDIKELKNFANELRKSVIRMVTAANSGHPGGPLGLADIYAVLYKKILNHKPSNPDWEERDRLILSNGHVCAIRYAAMAHSGYFPVEDLLTFRKLGSKLQGHPSTRYMSGIESSSGSLGQGLSVSVGLALGARFKKQSHKIYTCISDGECGEGMTWEAAQSAAHYKLDNLIAFMDKNGIQIDGFTKDIMNLEPLSKKFLSFGWNVLEADGHDIEQIISTFEKAKLHKGSPTIILFDTVLGKGVSFMENNPGWHGTPPKPEEEKKALEELSAPSV
ncbi:transketolase, thiamine pyrophosphate-binding domain protein [Leptospira weilii serovar Topaz str. LT2116]|uniref:Transketolase, thiamine pyrophosphate-binding domain protein n=1 Tax=Leptospira weilii serovar Topaz str. LT2116 TaxID=1088540 RepID=M3H1W1_9LEPT|nr:transketolase [Leptospira weilii]EMF82755.1 transketolase, thiamine pyrophosphate-binding domain protein [Leptospira weilii serovar Topaz str. LT2116]